MTTQQRDPGTTEAPRTGAGRTLRDRLLDLFAAWESLAEYHNFQTDEMADPVDPILAIEAEAIALGMGEITAALAADMQEAEAATAKRAVGNEYSERLLRQIRAFIPDDGSRQHAEANLSDALLGAATAERERAERLLDAVAKGLGLFLYNRGFHTSHEESVTDARAMIAEWAEAAAR